MKILVLGSGLMGPAAAFNAMCDPDVTAVTLADRDAAQLDLARARLDGKPGMDKLTTTQLDLADFDAATALMAQHDVIVAALPNVAIPAGIRAAAAAGVPWVDLSWPTDDQMGALLDAVNAAGILVVPGCGVEPGLTEIAARNLADKLDEVDEVHIKCGGIPVEPSGPLDYKIVFGGRGQTTSRAGSVMSTLLRRKNLMKARTMEILLFLLAMVSGVPLKVRTRSRLTW